MCITLVSCGVEPQSKLTSEGDRRVIMKLTDQFWGRVSWNSQGDKMT